MFSVWNNADFVDSLVDCQDLTLYQNCVTPALVNIKPGLPALLGYSVIGYQVLLAWEQSRSPGRNDKEGFGKVRKCVPVSAAERLWKQRGCSHISSKISHNSCSHSGRRNLPSGTRIKQWTWMQQQMPGPSLDHTGCQSHHPQSGGRGISGRAAKSSCKLEEFQVDRRL